MKIITTDQIQQIRKNKTLVTTNGSFDLLHVAHLRILQAAKKMGDILLVLVNSDISVQSNKGPKRPIVPQQERLEMLSGLACVDYLLQFDQKEVISVLEQIKPDIHVKGGTYIPERIAGEKNLVEQHGGKFVALDKIGDYASSNIIQRILESQ